MLVNPKLALMYEDVFTAKLDEHILRHCAGLKSFTTQSVEEIKSDLAHALRLADIERSFAGQSTRKGGLGIAPESIRYHVWHATQTAKIDGRHVLAKAFGEMSRAEQWAHLKEHPKFITELVANRLHPIKLAAPILRLPTQASHGTGSLARGDQAFARLEKARNAESAAADGMNQVAPTPARMPHQPIEVPGLLDEAMQENTLGEQTARLQDRARAQAQAAESVNAGVRRYTNR